jgi:hypothetical protein
METFTNWVRLPNGATVQVFVQANSHGAAQMLFEAQYGKANLLHLATLA